MHLARQQIDREADIVVGDSENSMPDHQRSAADIIAIDSPIPKPAAPPRIIRSSCADALDTDQLAAVLARILEL